MQAVSMSYVRGVAEDQITCRVNAGSLAINALHLRGTTFALPSLVGSLTSPLLIVPGGKTIEVYSETQAKGNVEVYFRGFLVDDLSY